MNLQYSVYKYEELFEKFNDLTDKSEDVIKFFDTFSFNNIINQNLDKGNSAYVFKNIIKEDTTKSKIVGLLNKLHQQNLTKITSMIREIVFQTQDELYDLVHQCIQKIKRDSDQIRPLVAALCWELLSTFFITSEGEKIYFRKLLLSEVKKDYIINVNYDNDEWTKDSAEKNIILIGTLFNHKIIENNIMSSIINDFKKNIEYVEGKSQEHYEKVEKSIQQLSCLVSCIVLNEDSLKIYNNLDVFLETQVAIYEDVKCISKKIRLVCKNTIAELRKNN
jgi:hypothetical protein